MLWIASCAILSAVLHRSYGFTNGTLIPAYICGPQGDGYPKSAGDLIPYLQLGTADDAYDEFPPTTTNQAIENPPSSRSLIGAFHDGNPPNYIYPVINAAWIAPLNSDPQTAAGNYVITPGALHSFTIAVNCPFASDVVGNPPNHGYNNNQSALDGFLAYALDTATNERIGSWVNVGPTLENFYGCNPTGTASVSVGIVHNSLVTCNSNLANLTWQAPAAIQGLVRFIGVGVTDCGFGPLNITYNTTTNQNALSIVEQGLIVNDSEFFMAYSYKEPAPDLPQYTPVTNTASGISAPIAVGIGVGSAAVGGLGASLGFFIMIRKKTGVPTDKRSPLLL